MVSWYQNIISSSACRWGLVLGLIHSNATCTALNTTESDAIGIRYQKKLSCAACIWALHSCWFIRAVSLMNSNNIRGTGICMENKCSDSESFITQDDINNYESRCNEWISRMGRVALTVSTIDNVCSACTCTRNTRFLRSITTLNFTTGSCLSSLENESFTVKPIILPSIVLVFYNKRCVMFDVNSKQFIAFY